MSFPPERVWLQWLGMPITLAIVGAAFGCSSGEEVTEQAIAQAKQRWITAGIRDYDLEWTLTGPNNAHYHVTVQAGQVSKIESQAPDGRRFEIHSPAPRYFGVDGLFLTIANEIALLKTDRPFNRPTGTKVVMRFQPDFELGYPRWYRRDVVGTSQAMTIEVIKLVPDSSNSKHLNH